MNKGELVAALAAKTEMTKKESEAALNGIDRLRHLRSEESSGSRGPQSPHRRFREDRCLQGSRFQGRQGSEGRCEQEEEVIQGSQKKP